MANETLTLDAFRAKLAVAEQSGVADVTKKRVSTLNSFANGAEPFAAVPMIGKGRNGKAIAPKSIVAAYNKLIESGNVEDVEATLIDDVAYLIRTSVVRTTV